MTSFLEQTKIGTSARLQSLQNRKQRRCSTDYKRFIASQSVFNIRRRPNCASQNNAIEFISPTPNSQKCHQSTGIDYWKKSALGCVWDYEIGALSTLPSPGAILKTETAVVCSPPSDYSNCTCRPVWRVVQLA
jgi:hypothetical protein